jgi:hypothetical protein
MPTINPSLIPTVNPGSLFNILTTNNSLAVRWLTAADPHYFDVYNRPMADILVRQLIIAKTVDQVGLRLSHQGLFPFLVNPTVNVGTSKLSLPVSWIWDSHVSLRDTYRSVRLAKIIRINGVSGGTGSGGTGSTTGTFRLVFTGIPFGGSSEIGLFYVDYIIDSTLSFQIVYVSPCTSTEFNPSISPTEYQTIAGYIIFRTLDTELEAAFIDALAPSITSGGFVAYDMSDTEIGGSGVDGDYTFPAVIHGTGLLVVSAYNLVPPMGIDYESILNSLGYPWRIGANLSSVDGTSNGVITIPSGMFDQFTLSAPVGDRDSQVLEDNFPVLCTRVRRLDPASNNLEFVFSTYNTIIGSNNKELIEFATLTLNRSNTPGTLIEIVPFKNLRNNTDPDSATFAQNFGSGYVILSSIWATSNVVAQFFDSFLSIINDPADRLFNANLGEFALHRAPMQVPTLGESSALAGSTSRRQNPIHPSDNNRYICESDQGIGDAVDLIANGFTENSDIDNFGYTGSLCRRSIVLRVNSANDANFDYDKDILPRLRKLLGRDPIHADEWFDGVVWKRFDSLSGTWIG